MGGAALGKRHRAHAAHRHAVALLWQLGQVRSPGACDPLSLHPRVFTERWAPLSSPHCPMLSFAAARYAAVALGAVSAFVQHPPPRAPAPPPGLKSWDHAAGVCVVAEAGGACTDLAGQPLRMPGRDFAPAGAGVLVTNRRLHEQGLHALRRGLPLRLVLLDRDGVINADVGPPGVLRRQDLTLLPGAAAAVRALNAAGVRVVLVTNQSAVGKGYLSADGLDVIHASLATLLATEGAALDDILVCPDVESAGSPRRKPAPGMVLEALAGAHVLACQAALVGDSITDLQAAAAVGVRRILVATGYGRALGEAATAAGALLPLQLSVPAPLWAATALPEAVMPCELHADLSSAVAALLLHDSGSSEEEEKKRTM